ncbi:MAG: hypothetical protein LAP87_07530 [Acidobacteriia bacterium]|nr:hypothetical protein [Terriglobia bacterium]
MRKLQAGAALLLASSAWAGAPYYLTDNFASIDGSQWTAAGALAARSGLAAMDANGGSLVSRIPIPDGSGEAEVHLAVRGGADGLCQQPVRAASGYGRVGVQRHHESSPLSLMSREPPADKHRRARNWKRQQGEL